MRVVSFTDIHSHVLHCVDDGSPDLTKAIETLRQMQRSGVRSLILTPHFCKRRGYETSVEKIKAAFDEICDACKNENISISLYLGTEMEYSTDAVRYIREGRVLTLADSDHILVEFAPYAGTATIVRACKEILQLGLVPVIAHIERYESLYSSFQTLYVIKELGAKIQLNMRSFCTMRFKTRRFLKRVISQRLADFVAGDVHLTPLERKEISKCTCFIEKHSSKEYLNELLNENAKNIIYGR